MLINFYSKILKLTLAVMTIGMLSCSKDSEKEPEPEVVKDEAESIYVTDYKRVAYMTYTGKLYSIDAKTGVKKWEFPISYAAKNAPEVSDGIVYVWGVDVVQAIDATTGIKKWERKTPNEFTGFDAVTVADKTVFAADNSGLYAMDANTGAEKWAKYYGLIISKMTVVEGTVYFGTLNGKFYAVDALTGKEKWAVSIPVGHDLKPAYVDGALLIPSTNANKLYSLNAATGQTKWIFEAGESFEYTPAINNGILYLGVDHGSFEDYLYAIDLASGKEKWKVPVNYTIESPIVSNGSVFSNTVWSLRAFDIAAGREKWVFESKSLKARFNAPVAVNDVVYTSCNEPDGSLFALDGETGTTKWTFKSDSKEYMSSPTVITKAGKVFLPSTSGAK
ncbi:PQQ-binding-like beta-propeller repeat protein [Dyadobacter sp. CY312]|uniref:PQQ-binding-like beta-propeller repeat protein n=1 Tax=Dyadobacter sp. CY312 TaxID=2907303 RepID=UPI001F29AA5E|nr:PQQ-binding-like beta-propeller repeat protein [Dyadobacter sp. CY312]MCE7044257.1 PQQ-binding-like beta-propeller repeat protein [Dyadobacter sp. CY312]